MKTTRRYTLACLFYVVSAALFTYGATRYFVTRDLVARQIRAYESYADTEARLFFAQYPDAAYQTPVHLDVLEDTLVSSGSPYQFWDWMILCFLAGTGTAFLGGGYHWLASKELGLEPTVLKMIVNARWKWVAGVEVLGMSIVASGILWYTMIAERPKTIFTARNVGEYTHPREIAGAIITPGGLLLALGYFGILASSVLGLSFEPDTRWQQPAGRQRGLAVLPCLLLPVPFLVPLGVECLYRPINEHFTANYFGCGCYFGFNANSVNFILWLQVLAVCTAMWLSLVRWMLRRQGTATAPHVAPKIFQLLIMAAGSIGLACIVFRQCGRSLWM